MEFRHTQLYIFILILCFSAFNPLYATHQRAGEITYRHISDLTYEITITTYTFAPSAADRCELTINWGDGQNSILGRTNGPPGITPAGIQCNHTGEMVGRDIRKNIYIGVHTYPSASTYRIWLEDPNRNMGIQNIPNSVDVPLYLETVLVINPFLGNNSSPQLLLPPIDNACIGIPFIHNPGAFDPNGDSLSYKLVTPRGAGGLNILGYQLPNLVDTENPGTFTINEVTGDILWDSPTIQGEYNIALIIEEWRNGVRIGYITRDMQINAIACDNDPPKIGELFDTCVIAGSTLRMDISASDENGDGITLTASGGPMTLSSNPATFNITSDMPGLTTGVLEWSVTCSQVRNQSYQIYFRAEDDASPISLVDLATLNIKVIAPPVENVSAEPLGNTISLDWDRAFCNEAVGYKIYRRTGTSDFIPGECVTGVPPETGYQLIQTTQGIQNTGFTDDNNGTGLVRGVMYCYLITYYFNDGAESKASEEVCTDLKKDLPVITNVSVLSTSGTNGEMYIAWSKPTELDTIQTPGPFIYKIYRSTGSVTDNPVIIAEFNDLNDTVYTDADINTLDFAYTYEIELINNSPGNVFSVGFSVPASSVYITTTPSDELITININYNVPWSNEEYVIYRRPAGSDVFDSIALVRVAVYTDTALINGVSYCYYVKTLGTYGSPGYIDPLINLSQIKCDVPLDNIAPCPPMLTATINCEDHTIFFAWENIQLTCAPDIANYQLWQQGNPSTLLATIEPAETSYLYTLPNQSISACYFIVAADTNGNVDTTNYFAYCLGIDDCPRYRLPNVFTPNSDNINDFFVPFPGYTSVERVEMQIFNRWGILVFETNNPEIKWDGRDKNTNNLCPEGVYFYRCIVYEAVGSPDAPEETSTQKRTIQNSLHLLY
jgi:gliding motility-associated-like protein